MASRALSERRPCQPAHQRVAHAGRHRTDVVTHERREHGHRPLVLGRHEVGIDDEFSAAVRIGRRQLDGQAQLAFGQLARADVEVRPVILADFVAGELEALLELADLEPVDVAIDVADGVAEALENPVRRPVRGDEHRRRLPDALRLRLVHRLDQRGLQKRREVRDQLPALLGREHALDGRQPRQVLRLDAPVDPLFLHAVGSTGAVTDKAPQAQRSGRGAMADPATVSRRPADRVGAGDHDRPGVVLVRAGRFRQRQDLRALREVGAALGVERRGRKIDRLDPALLVVELDGHPRGVDPARDRRVDARHTRRELAVQVARHLAAVADLRVAHRDERAAHDAAGAVPGRLRRRRLGEREEGSEKEHPRAALRRLSRQRPFRSGGDRCSRCRSTRPAAGTCS